MPTSRQKTVFSTPPHVAPNPFPTAAADDAAPELTWWDDLRARLTADPTLLVNDALLDEIEAASDSKLSARRRALTRYFGLPA